MQLHHLENPPLNGAVMSAYRDIISAFGSNGSQERIERALNSIAPVDRFYVSERSDPFQPPHLIAHRLEGGLANRMGDYLERYFLRDPIARAIQEAREDGTTVMLRVCPEDIVETEYRQSFYDEAEVVERLSFVQRLSDRWLVLNIARRAPSRLFNDEELGGFANLSQLLLPVVARQAEMGPTAPRPHILGVEEIEQRFAEQFPELSRRERQVCARTVVGMTSEASALCLGIGIGSVHTYRKRAFQRLEICSAFQLAHLVLH